MCGWLKTCEEGGGLWGWERWVLNLKAQLWSLTELKSNFATSCVRSGKLLELSELQFPFL